MTLLRDTPIWLETGSWKATYAQDAAQVAQKVLEGRKPKPGSQAKPKRLEELLRAIGNQMT
jgi:hypothetical protein